MGQLIEVENKGNTVGKPTKPTSEVEQDQIEGAVGNTVEKLPEPAITQEHVNGGGKPQRTKREREPRIDIWREKDKAGRNDKGSHGPEKQNVYAPTDPC